VISQNRLCCQAQEYGLTRNATPVGEMMLMHLALGLKGLLISPFRHGFRSPHFHPSYSLVSVPKAPVAFSKRQDGFADMENTFANCPHWVEGLRYMH
jgi:hypothetical protein